MFGSYEDGATLIFIYLCQLGSVNRTLTTRVACIPAQCARPPMQSGSEGQYSQSIGDNKMYSINKYHVLAYLLVKVCRCCALS